MTEPATAPVEPTVTPAPIVPPAPKPDNDEHPWLPARLARKEKEIAKRFGAETIEDLEARLAKLTKLEQESMSETEKLRARNAELEAAAKERDEYKATIGEQAKAALAGLTQEQREAVLDVAETPAKQLKAIEKLRATWVKPAEPQKVVPAPASTTPTPSAPPGTSPSSGPDHLATWEGLQKTNQMAAALYLDKFQVQILEQKKARSK
jgi:hypothetical protein